jgi:hypothetical protein
MLEGPVASVVLGRNQSLERVARGREQCEVAHRAERAAGRLGVVFLHEVAEDEVHRAGGGEVTVLDEVRALEAIESLHGLGDQKMEIGIALAVGVAAQVDRQSVDEEGDVGAVVGVEAAEKVLLGLPAALVLADDEPGDEAQDVGRPAMRTQLEVAPGNEDLRRRGDRRRRRHDDRRQSRLLFRARQRRFLLDGGRRLLLDRGRRLRCWRWSLLGE